MIGSGFQECLSPVLTSRLALVKKMRLEGIVEDELVEIDNVMSELYSILRNSLLPSLLNVESLSSKAVYPHKVFEVGEVARIVEGDFPEARTFVNLASYVAHPKASFSELHSYLDALFYYLGVEYKLEPESHPTYLDGRAGAIVVVGAASPAATGPVGLIGEVHPEVLERWGITMPAAAFEISLTKLFEICGA